jgi:hypothetical protein
MRIFLHIGAEKTGTKSIQQFFHVNRATLQRELFLYSSAAGGENHMALSAASQADNKFDDLRIIYGLDTPQKVRDYRVSLAKSLADEVREANYSTLIFSGEHCSSRLTSSSEIETLAGILRPLSKDITIILYIRRQDEFLCSTYSTDIKSGHTGHFVVPPESLQNTRYDYHSLLRRWSAIFGKENIVCRIYDSAKLKNGDVVSDFADIIGLKLKEKYQYPSRANESLDVTTLEFLRLLNAEIPKFKDKKPNKFRANLVHLLQGLSKGPSATLSDQQMQEFMERFRETNEKVAREFFDGAISETGDPLFGAALGRKNRAEVKAITVDSAIEITARLWQKKQEQVLKQSERIAELEKIVRAKR